MKKLIYSLIALSMINIASVQNVKADDSDMGMEHEAVEAYDDASQDMAQDDVEEQAPEKKEAKTKKVAKRKASKKAHKKTK